MHEVVVREWSVGGFFTEGLCKEHNALVRAYLTKKAALAAANERAEKAEAELRGAGHEGIATLRRSLTDETARATAAEAQVAALREYARHATGCKRGEFRNDYPCTCLLDEVLAGLDAARQP